jgi:type II secretory ATPase GspE/PulE/Tfp pilus assembly ATPase PilB-like protein
MPTTRAPEREHADWSRVDPSAQRLVPEWFARAKNVFPLRYDHAELVVATSDPDDLMVEDALAFAAGRAVQFELATPEELQAAWASGYDARRLDAGEAEGAEEASTEQSLAEGLSTSDDEGPIAQFAHTLMERALDARASDLHLEPGPAGGVARARIDGVLQRVAHIPRERFTRTISRLKVSAGLDIAEQRRPQDGRATHIRQSGAAVELRVSVIPTRDGEKLVIRFLDPGNARSLQELGLLEPESNALLRLLDRRDGIVVITGPTGSGKTSTLYAALGRIDTSSVNVCTVEDPVEYRLVRSAPSCARIRT